MKKKHLIFLKTPLLLLLFAIIISSCVPQRKIKYLQQQADEATKTEFVNTKKINYTIQPGDNLYIKISSINQKANSIFNTESQYRQQYMNNDISVYLNSYTVDDNGSIDFPLVGEFTVNNLTTEEIKVKLQEKLKEYIKESTVIVKLVNFYVTLLGEITRPGEYKIYQDEINIFEALSLAGDLGDFADRNNIVLVRQTKNGSEIHRLDLTSSNILESDYFYLVPNDIIYVEPLKGKQFTFANFPYATIFSAISTTLLLINFFK
ncbi:MAG: polysaccharide biosynthesis/export family protein [Saprospiraceae bacterium]|nr:polysaccharide biosynthesis/export family protein [Saprospiraceae bacterium]